MQHLNANLNVALFPLKQNKISSSIKCFTLKGHSNPIITHNIFTTVGTVTWGASFKRNRADSCLRVLLEKIWRTYSFRTC